VPDTGWAPCFLLLRDGRGTLAAAAPLYLKSHSWGEFVFDHAWADAYRRHGLPYYPKLLGAVPFTPVPGTRLLARDAAARRRLAAAIRAFAATQRLSSAHVLFGGEADREALAAEGFLLRESVQFHWQQDARAPQADFAALLASMQREKRKKIQQERRRVAEAGIGFEVLEGTAIDEAAWDFFHRCYERTYAEHHSTPYLTRDFFGRAARALPANWLMFVAVREGRRLAASLLVIDREAPGGAVAWGRHWGAVEHVPLLHFEACYYRPLEWCLANGFVRFEGGAQGEHKMARGLLPVRTGSAHWLRDPRFASAVEDFLAREGPGVAAYVDELRERSPFKASG
jgi:predicted N-acyltransferase